MRTEFSTGRLARLASLIAIMSGCAGAVFGAQVVDTFERNFTVSERPTIFLRNTDGRTRITADAPGRVHVGVIKEVKNAANQAEAAKVAERVQVRIEQSGSRIEVEAKYPRTMHAFFGNEPEVLVHLEISAPKSSDVDARSSDGSMSIYGFDGRIETTTGDGELTVDNCSGHIVAQTGDGSLRIESTRGDVSAHSGDGKILLDGIFQGLEAKSGDGRIDVTARTGSKMEKDWSIRSGDGDVRLRLPEGFAATLEVSTGDGSIDCEQPVTREDHTSKNHLNGKLNNGGYKLRIQTSDGDVHLVKS
ncbi:MAG TPA: DUF4097 family beta strand repeat-containing protein [Acidobacteriota bacterium]|nr:DUF4097 family beta strand repeat-containing protein [Acidobacteriota bacterium]